MSAKIKPIQGFVLHFGYVESSRVAPIIIRHDYGFDGLLEALQSLAHFFAKNFALECCHVFDMWARYHKEEGRPPPAYPTFLEFRQWLYDQPISTAAEAPTFDSQRLETWWPWNSFNDILKLLSRFYENVAGAVGAETLIPLYLDVDALEKELCEQNEFSDFDKLVAEYPNNDYLTAFFQEIRREQMIEPGSDHHIEYQQSLRDPKRQFKRIGSRSR